MPTGTQFQEGIVWRVIYDRRQLDLNEVAGTCLSLEAGKIGPRRYIKTNLSGLRVLRDNLYKLVVSWNRLPTDFLRINQARLDSAISADNVAALIGFLVGDEPTVMLDGRPT